MNLVRHPDSTIRGFATGGEDDFGAIGFQHAAPLHADTGRHDQLNAVSAGGGDHGQGDAGIAGCGLKYYLVRGQFSACLGGKNHLTCRTVFY